ncbi:MAG: hypothetical protein IPN00_10840 [Hydrogenophilales bacterium]|nr:hypothetical protein [Hydrogenophilales bacterium]
MSRAEPARPGSPRKSAAWPGQRGQHQDLSWWAALRARRWPAWNTAPTSSWASRAASWTVPATGSLNLDALNTLVFDEADRACWTWAYDDMVFVARQT